MSGTKKTQGFAPKFVGGEPVMRKLADYEPNDWNPNELTEDESKALREVLRTIGWVRSQAMLVWASDEKGRKKNLIIDGEHRWSEAIALGFIEGPVVELHKATRAEAIAWTFRVDKIRGAFNDELTAQVLHREFGLFAGRDADTFDTALHLGFSPDELEGLRINLKPDDFQSGSGTALPSMVNVDRPTLADRFIVPPFTVLDARQGYWQERKRQWIAVGIRGGDGRADSLPDGARSVAPSGAPKPLDRAKGAKVAGRRMTWAAGTRPIEVLDDTSRRIAATGAGVSMFDPVLCELVVRWFCPPSGHVVDCFGGGSTLGVVSSILGRTYTGVEIRKEQILATKKQIKSIKFDGAPPRYVLGNSAKMRELGVERADLIFTDPPYFNLEVYSDRDGEGSTKRTYKDFLEWYEVILREAVAVLRDDRFFVVKIGEVRDGTGQYVNLVGDTNRLLMEAGLRYYNEAILVTAVGSLPVRTGKAFAASRKLGKAHQNVLIFVKGDERAATAACGIVDVSGFEEADE